MPVYDDKCIKTKIRTHGNKVYTDFYDLGVPEDGVECECILIISIDSIFEKKHYLHIDFDEGPYGIVDKQIMRYLDYNVIDFNKN